MSEKEDLRYQSIFSPYGIDANDARDQLQNLETAERIDELNKQYSLCFSTPSGKKVLEDLISKTLEQPTWPLCQGYNDVHHGFMREGQNSIVRSIIGRIESVTKKGK